MILVKRGYNVCLLDLDVYAPSMQTYYGITPNYWINNYLNSNATIKDIMINLTYLVYDLIIKHDKNDVKRDTLKGNLWVAFSNPCKEEVLKLEINNTENSSIRKQRFRKFILLRERLVSDHNADYIIIDTSPRYPILVYKCSSPI